MIQPFFLYVFFHILGHKFLEWAFCLHCIADFGRRNLLIHIVQQVQNDSGKNEVALGWLLRKRFRGLCPGTESLRQSVCHVSEEEARTAGYDKFAFRKQRFGFAPLGNIFKCVNSDEEKQAIALLERLLKFANCVNAVVRSRRNTSARSLLIVKNEFSRSLEQSSHEQLLVLRRQRSHRATMEIRRNRLGGRSPPHLISIREAATPLRMTGDCFQLLPPAPRAEPALLSLPSHILISRHLPR